MTLLSLFPTRVYTAKLQASGGAAFNTRLLRECEQYRADDAAGREWSRGRYPGGYTSYGSLNRMHTLSPTLWTRDGRLELLLGTRGGSYQPQLLVQVAAHLLRRRSSPAESQARPRWVIDRHPERVRLEASAGDKVAQELASRGHRIQPAGEFERGWGPVSMIQIGRSGLRTAASDPRAPTALAAVR